MGEHIVCGIQPGKSILDKAEDIVEMESNLMNAYQTAYRMACEELANREIDDICLNTNAERVAGEDSIIILSYLASSYTVDLKSGCIAETGSDKQVSTTVKVLLLHYLLNSKISPLTGKMISFKEIPGGGAIYYQTFFKRAITPLIKTFADDIDGFFNAAEKIGGTRESYGDASVTLKIFPLVPVTYVIWQGDDEFPATGTILFDEKVTSFLPGEDIVLAASFGVYALMAEAGKKQII